MLLLSKNNYSQFFLNGHLYNGVFTWENSHRREFHTGMTFLISYRVYIMTGSFHISLFEGTLHVDKVRKIQNRKYYRQTDFTPKRVVVSRLHDTVARFRSGVKFSPRYKNRGELTPGWLARAWHFVVAPCKQI